MSASVPKLERTPRHTTTSVVSFAAFLLFCSYYFENVAAVLFSVSVLLSALILRYPRLSPMALILAATCLALSAVEVSIPILIHGEKKEWMYVRNGSYPDKYYSDHNDVGSVAKAGVYEVQKITTKGREIYRVHYSIGPDGFRPTLPEHNSPLRVNFFGCSFTFGEGVNDNETLPYFVNKEMPDVRVKNFGFHGWGANNALALLQSSRDTSGSINFFLTAPWHIFRSACKVNWVDHHPKYRLLKEGRLIRAGQCKPKKRKNTFIQCLHRSNIYETIDVLRQKQMTRYDVDLYLALVKSMAEISHTREQKLIIGFIRAEEAIFAGTNMSNDYLYAKLQEIADDIIDLTLADSSGNIDKKFYISKLDRHPSVLANKARATLVVDLIRKYRPEARVEPLAEDPTPAP